TLRTTVTVGTQAASGVAARFTSVDSAARYSGATGPLRNPGPLTLTTYPDRARLINCSTISLWLRFSARHAAPRRRNASGEMTTAVFTRLGLATTKRLFDLAFGPVLRVDPIVRIVPRSIGSSLIS